MAADRNQEERLAELAEGELSGEALERWLAEHPELAADLIAARRVHALVEALRAAEFEVPADFEARVLARIRQDATLSSLLDLGINGVSTLLLELVALVFGLAPRAPAPAAQ